MSQNDDNSENKDKDFDNEKYISLNEDEKKPENLLSRKRVLSERLENNNKNNESDSDDLYAEEEDEEEGGEIDDDEDEINSEFKNVKKRKLESQQNIQIWSRKKSENVDIEESLSSASIVINESENKNNKNENKEKTTNNIQLQGSSKKSTTNFLVTPRTDNTEQKNQMYFNIKNQNSSTSYDINYFNSLVQNPNVNENYIKNMKLNMSNNTNSIYNNNNAYNLTPNNINNKNFNFMLPENKINPDIRKMNMPYPVNPNMSQAFNTKKMYPDCFNYIRLKPLLERNLIKYHLKIDQEELEKILFLLRDKLKDYLRIYMTRLISISRIRNANFNLYSNNPNGQTHYKFKTYNWVSEDEAKAKFSPSKIFDILFTSNFKKKFDLIEEFVELNNKKTKFEKLSSCKEKYEESSKTKGIESSIKITDGPNPTIKLLPGRRTKKKNNTFFKEMRKKIVQTKKKEDLVKQKTFTKDTLDTFLNDSSNVFNAQNSFTSLPNLLDGGLTSKMDLSSRMSDTVSHNNYSYTNNYINNSAQNEISMNVFTYFDPTKDGKIYGRQKKRIGLKDFIFLLENSTEFIPNKIMLLNEAALDNTKNK